MTEQAFFCPKCRTTTTRQGRQPYCRLCMREANRKTREKYAARTLEEVLAAQPDECVCPVCKMLRSKTEFSIDRTRRNGLQAICTPCRVLMNKLAHQLKQS